MSIRDCRYPVRTEDASHDRELTAHVTAHDESRHAQLSKTPSSTVDDQDLKADVTMF